MFRSLISTLSTIHLAFLLLATPATSGPCTFNTAACNTQRICTPIEYTQCLIAHNSISASIACISEANKLLNNWWNEPANPNTCINKNPDADDDTNDIDNFPVSFGQEFVKTAQSPSCNCSPGGAINDCSINWTDDAAFAKCLCQDGVSNDDLRCLHSCLQATGVEYCFSDFCNSGSKAGTLFDQAVLGSCRNPTNEAASDGGSSGGGGDSSGAAATPDAPAAAPSAAASSSAVSSTVSPSSTTATANQATSPSSTLPSSSTSAPTSPTRSGSEARRIKARDLGYLFLIVFVV